MTTHYLDTDVSGGTGDGSSLANAFSSLQDWVDNVGTISDDITILCHATSGTADTGVSSWGKNDGGYEILIKASDDDRAVKDDGIDATKYRITGQMSFSTYAASFDGIQFDGDSAWNYLISYSYATGTLSKTFSNCVVHGAANTGGLDINNAYWTLTVTNSIFVCALRGIRVNNGTAYIYNSICTGGSDGIQVGSSGTATITNCAVFNNADDFDVSGTGTISYCASDDGDGTNALSPLTSDWDNEFSDYANDDYTLLSGGNLYEAGTDLSIAEDIDGDSYHATTPSVGVDEPVTATVSVTGVTIIGAEELNDGITVPLTADVEPATATDDTVSWESSNDSVATVDSDGEVTGIAAGTVTITVTTTDGDFTDTHTITVLEETVVEAASLSHAHVQAAVDAANVGDTVVLPAGTADWTADADDVEIAKDIIVRGAGATATVISSSGIGMFELDGPCRLTQIGLTANVSTFDMVNPHQQGWRIDHCKFINTTSSTVEGVGCSSGSTEDPPQGLIDHCYFDECRVAVFGSMNLYGHHIWFEDTDLGTDNAVFVEDNIFQKRRFGNVIDGNYGGRFVFRYNQVYDGYLEAHSAQNGSRGIRSWEFYENDIAQEDEVIYRSFSIRGGTGVVWNNRVTGTFTIEIICLDNVRSDLRISDPTNIWAADGVHPWDGNDAGGLPHPCRDQIGRGKDATLFTGTTDETSVLPDQASEPAYAWGNTINGDALEFDALGDYSASAVDIVEDRDFFNASEAPTGYTPYTYPHPLQAVPSSGGGSSKRFFKVFGKMVF